MAALIQCGRADVHGCGLAVNQLDVYRTASVLIRKHGAQAGAEAAKRAACMDARGNVDCAAVWRLVAAAVDEISRSAPVEGQVTH